MLKENLKSYRKLKGWTQEQMAAEFSVTRDNIASYERGLANPSLEFVCKICDDTKVTLHTLLYEEIMNPKLVVDKPSERMLQLETELARAYKAIAQMQMEKMQVLPGQVQEMDESRAAEPDPDK